MAQFVTSLQPSLADMSRTPHAGHPPHPHPPPHKGHGHEKEKEKIAQKMAKEQQQLQQQQQQAHSKHAAQAAAAASVPERVAEKSDGNTAFLRAARAGNLDKVLEHLKSDVDINTANANGLNALHLASKEGHTHVVTELLSRGATVDASTKKGNTALHIASLAGQEEVVRLLVQHGAAVNVQSQNGFTPLYMAAQENHDNVVKFLLANGANQSLATEDGFTPLAVAMQQGHDKVVAVLLENDTRGKVRLPALHIAAKKDDCKAAALLLQNEHNPDVTSKSGFTPLHIAAHYGNEAIANLLLNKGADVNYSAKHNISPLHVAAKWGKTNLVALLLERGAHIEAKTRDGLTPLHCAARSGHEQVVDMMLERGAPISCKTKNGLAPLHMAAQGDHVDAARILLYHRAPVDEITVDYLTALHVAAHCGHVRVAKLLLDRKADPNARALNGFTPLHIACKKNRIKVVELLLKHGASIEATTESGLTPLHVASFMGCMNIVIYLLQNEANPDVPTVRGETPLHLAARANQTDIIRILLRNGAQVDARAREQQTPLHIASRLGNVDIVMLLLQHGAAVDSTTKDLYTALHIAAKEGQEEVAAVLLENGASLTATTNKGCTPLHLAAKYGNMKVAKLLLQKDAPVDSQGKNGVTPLHVASHYDHQSVALLLLDKGASPHATAKNGHTPLHIAARKNQMDIATTLLEYGAKANAESRAGFTPLHLSAQEGHTDMSTLLIEHQADTNHQAKNGLTPLHLCAQEDRVNVAQILVKSGANVDSITKAGYTPLHVASHFGQVNMVRFLLQHGADTGAVTSVGYTPLHQAAQQGHSGVVSILLNSGAQPNVTTKQGQTALSIAQKLGYISVVETLKVVTEITTITTTTTTTIEEKYRVVAPETMQETFMSDSEEEGGDQGLECTGMYFGKPTHAQHVYLPYYEGQSLLKREDTLLNEQPYHYLTVDEMKSLGDDSLPIDVTQDDRHDSNRDLVSPQHVKEVYSAQLNYASDNVDISRHPVNVGKLKWKNFLVSFLVDARGGAMRGCRHSGVRVIVPPRKAPQPLRVTCRYLKRDKLSHPPPLMEGEALASRILELGPVGAKFLGPVIIEVPHFGSLRGREREIVILRSDNGETWREHTVEASEDAIHDVLNESFEKDGERNELSQLEVCDSGRLTRILTTDFPQYFAVVSRVRQEVHAIGPEGGMVSSSVVPQVQAVFPQGALTKKIKVGLQAQPIQADLVAKLLGNRVAVSPIVTVEPRRRKFHKPITLTIPVPQAANKGMINQYSGDAPTLRLLCSITGGTTRAQWEDVTGSTPLTFVNDCVSFTTTVSARFWLMDCRNISEATRMATELYKEAIHVPFLAKFVVFSKRVDFLEARLRVFCMTDDKEDKTLEHQEHFTEVAKSRDVEVLEGKSQFVEFAGNLVPVTKSGDQLQLGFRGFRENRLAFTTRVKDPHADAVGRILFMKEAKVQKGDPPQQPVCVLNIVLPDDIIPESSTAESTPQKYSHVHLSINGSSAPARPELRLSDISNTLGSDWESLAVELGLSRSDVDRIKSDHPASAAPQHAMAMLRLWLQKLGNKASGTELQQALQRLGRDDIIHRCMISCDDQEMNLTSSHLGLDQSGFDNLQEELGVSRDVSRDASREASLRRNLSLEAGGPYDEQDIMKVSRDSESVEELVEKPIHTIERIEEVKQIDKHHREQDDSEERKYVAEEKEVEEKRKSVRERTQDIEKRLSQTSMEDQQQRRDSQLFQGVSEGLERLNVTQATEAGDLLSPGVVQTPPPSPAELPYDAGEHNWHESKVSTTTTITSEQHSGSQVAVAAASPQEDEDLDADSFQEQFLLETPPSGITTRHGFIAVPDESDEEAVRTPSTPGAPQGASHSSRATSLLSSEKRDVAARIDKMQAMGVEFKQLESPGEEKGAADEKRAEHRKDVDRLAGGVGDDNPPTDSTTSDKSPRQSSRSTSPPAVCRVVQTPPTLELVIGHKKVRTRDASASSESTVTLYGSQDVEISIRSESHISVTRKEPGGKDSASASFDADVTEESESPLRRSARTGVDPQRSCAKVTYKDQSSPEHSSGIFILPSRKERKKEETVLFSGEESVYRYDQGEAIIASVDSPGTDESASHLITDTGISLTRGTTDTSPAQQPARGRADRDIDADIDGEESELTDAGLSPIQPDDIGLPPMSSDMKFYDEEVTLVSFTEMGTSPHDYQIESSSVALSPIEIPTSEASVYTDSVDTKDAGVSPIGSDDESLKQLSSISASAPVLPHDADLARSPEEDTESKRFKTELVIQIGPETSHSLPQKDPSPPKKIGPKVKELQKVFTEPDEGEDLKTAVQRTVDDDSDEESLRSHPGVSKIVEEIEDSLGTPKHARRSSSKDSPPRGASYDKISIDKVETEVTFSVMEDINKSIESDREELTVKVAGQSDGKRTVFVQETNLDNVSVHPITTKSQELQKTSKTTETPQAPQESNLHDRKIFEENVDEIIEREEVKQVVVKTTREETTEMENREDSSVLTFTVKTTAHEMNKVETVKETIAHVKTVTSHSEQQRQPFAQDLAATVSAMEKLRDTVENILPEFSSDHENRLTEKRDEGLPTGVETCLHKTEETLKRISEKLDVSGVPNEVSNQHHSIKTLAPDLLTAQTTLERIRKTLDDTELTAENTTVDNALTSDHAATATPEMSSPSAQVEEDSASTESSATLSAMELQKGATTHQENVGSLSTTSSIDGSHVVDVVRKEVCDPRPRSLQKEADHVVTERDVSDLMSEVAECTRQIKQEVRQLKPDLTPTPEGSDLGTLNLALARATGMSLIPEVSCSQTTELTIQHKEPDDHERLDSDLDGDTRPCSPPGERKVLSSEADLRVPSASTQDVDSVLETQAVADEKLDEGSEKVKSGKVEPATVLAIKATHDLLEAERKGRNIHTSEKSETDETIHVSSARADDGRTVESELRSALIVCVAVGQSMALDAVSKPSQEGEQLVDQSVECISDRSYAHLVKDEKDKVNDEIKVSGDRGEPSKYIMSIKSESKSLSEKIVTTKFDERMKSSENASSEIEDKEIKVVSLGKSPDVYTDKPITTPTAVDISVVDAKTTLKVTNDLLKSERACLHDFHPGLKTGLVLTDVSTIRDEKDPSVKIAVEDARLLADATKALDEEKNVKEEKVKQEITKAEAILSQGSSVKTDEQIIIEVEERLEKDIEMPAADSRESTPETRHKIRGKVKEAKKAVGGFFGSLMGRSRDSDSEQESDSGRSAIPKKSKKKKKGEKEMKNISEETVVTTQIRDELDSVGERNTDLLSTKHFLLNEKQSYHAEPDLKYVDEDDTHIDTETIESVTKSSEIALTDENELKQGQMGHKKKAGGFFGALRGKSKDGEEAKESTTKDTKLTETEAETDKTTLATTKAFLLNEQQMYQTDDILKIQSKPIVTEHQVADMAEIETEDKYLKGKIKGKGAKKVVGEFFGSLRSKGKDVSEETNDETKNKTDPDEINTEIEQDLQAFSEKRKTTDEPPKPKTDMLCKASNVNQIGDKSTLKQSEQTQLFLENEQKMYQTNKIDPIKKDTLQTEQIMAKGTELAEKQVKIRQEVDKAKATVAEAKEAVEESKEKAADTVSDIKDSVEHEKDEISKKGKSKVKEAKKAVGGFFGSLMGKGKDAAESVSDKVDESVREAKEAAEAAKTEVVEAKDSVASAAAEKADELEIKVQDTVTDVAAVVREGAEAIKDAVVGGAEKVGDAVDEVVSDGLKSLEAGADEAKATVAEAKEAVEESKEKAADTVSDIKDSAEHEKDEISKKGKCKAKDSLPMGQSEDTADSVSDIADKSPREAKEAAVSAKKEVVEVKDGVASTAAEKVDEVKIRVQDTVSDVAADIRMGAEAFVGAFVGEAEKVGEPSEGVAYERLTGLEAGADNAELTEIRIEAQDTVTYIGTDLKGLNDALVDEAEIVAVTDYRVVSDELKSLDAGVVEVKAFAAVAKGSVESSNENVAGTVLSEDSKRVLGGSNEGFIPLQSTAFQVGIESVVEMAVETLSDVLTDPEVINFTEPEIDLLLAADVGSEESDGNLKGKHSQETAFPVGGSFAQSDFDLTKQNSSSIVHEQVVEKSDGNLLFKEVAVILGHSSEEAVNPLNVGDSYRDSSFVAEDSEDTGYPISHDVTVDVVKAVAVETALTLTAPPVTGGDLFPIVAEESVMKKHTFSVGSPTKTLRTQVSDVPEESQVISQSSSDFDLELLAVQSALEQAPGVPVSSFELSGSDVSHTKLEEGIAHVSGDASNEPVCIQKVVHRASIDENFPDVDFSQFREVADDELHRQKSSISPPNLVSLRSARHTRDIASTESYPVEVEEMCVRRVVPELTSFEPSDVSEPIILDNQPLKTANPDMDAHAEASISILTDRFLVEERKLVEARPERVSHISSELLLERYSTLTGAFLSEERGTISKAPAGTNDKDMGEPQGEKENFASVQPGVDKPKLSDRSESHPRQVAAHEYDVNVFEKIATPISLSFSEPSQSFRSTEKVQVILSEVDNYCPPGEHPSITADLEKVSHCENLQSTKPLPVSQDIAQVDFKPESSDALSGSTKSHIIDPNDVSTAISQSSALEQYALRTTHITSLSEITSSNEAQSSIDSGNDLTCTKKSREVVNAPCIESVDLIESCDLSNAMKVETCVRGSASRGEQFDELRSGTVVESKHFTGGIAVCIDTTVEEVSSDVTDVSITTVSDAVETGSSFEITDTSNDRDSFTGGSERIVGGDSESFQMSQTLEIKHRASVEESSRSGVLQRISGGATAGIAEDNTFSTVSSEDFVERDYAVGDLLEQSALVTSQAESPNCDPPNNKEIERNDDMIEVSIDVPMSTEIEYELTAVEDLTDGNIRDDKELLALKTSKRRVEAVSSKMSRKVSTGSSTVSRTARAEKFQKLSSSTASGSVEGKYTNITRTSTSSTTSQRTVVDLPSKRSAQSKDQLSTSAMEPHISTSKVKSRGSLEIKKTEYQSPYRQTSAFNYMRSTVSRDAKRGKESQETIEKLSSSQKSSREGTPTKRVPLKQTTKSVSVTQSIQSGRSRHTTSEKDAQNTKMKQTHVQKSPRDNTPPRKYSTKQTAKLAGTSRPSSVSSTSSSTRRVSESSSASSTRSNTARSRSEYTAQPSSSASFKHTQRQSMTSKDAPHQKIYTASHTTSVRQTKYATKTSTSVTGVVLTEPSKIKRRERSAIPVSSSTKATTKPSKVPSNNVQKKTSQESVPSTITGEDFELTEPDSSSLIQDEAESLGILSPSGEAVSRRASSAPIPTSREPMLHSLHPRLQTSLPSSPSRLARAGNQGLVTQLLTSEVFTRTVESSEAVEVVYHQPERQRRPTEGEQSFIDTTDSSLSESTAIPSSSTSSDRRRSRSVSPKATKRSDVISTVDTADTVLCAIKEEQGDTPVTRSQHCDGFLTMCDIPVIAISSGDDESASAASHDAPGLLFTEDPSHLTDVDVFEASDTGDDEDGHRSPGVAIDACVEFDNTFHETLKMGDSPTHFETMSRSRPTGITLVALESELVDGSTDIEELEDDEGDFEIEEVEYNDDELRIIDTILGETGYVDIADELRGSISCSPSPSVTPDYLAKKHKHSARSIKKISKRKLLAPSHTWSQGDEQVDCAKSSNRLKSPSPRSRRRRSKSPRGLIPDMQSESITDIEDLDLSASEEHVREDITPTELDLPERGQMIISQVAPSSPSEILGADTEGEELALSDLDNPGVNLDIPPVPYLSVSPDVTEALTDFEDVDFDKDEIKTRITKEGRGSVDVIHISRPSRNKKECCESSCTSSDEELGLQRKCVTKRKVPRITLRRADEGDSSDHDESVELEKNSGPIIADRYGTDCEDIKFTDHSDIEEHSGLGVLNVLVSDIGGLTDTEIYEDDESLRPCTPEPDFDVTDERMPAPVRELTLLKEIEEGRPESVVLPLGDGRPLGLMVAAEETAGTTDTEYILGESEDEHFDCRSPDLPDIDGGSVKATDSVKYQKKTSKTLAAGTDFFDSLTDTEDANKNGWSKKRRAKKQVGLKHATSSLFVQEFQIGKSDVEEIEVSDFEESLKVENLGTNFQLLSIHHAQEEKTDVEDMSATSGLEEDEYDNTENRATPEIFKTFGVEVVASAEGDGPFTAERRKEITSYTSNLKCGSVSIPLEVSNTDIEDDFVTSADEELVRSARVSIDVEQSIIFDKSMRKINLEAPEEAPYVKGRLLGETHTDVEEVGLSEEEMTGHLTVVDQLPEICVCVTSHESGPLSSSVCVCVSRDQGHLSLRRNTSDLAAEDRDHSSDVASPQLEGISAYSTEMNHPAHYNVKPEPDALQPNDINHDSAFKSSNNSPVLEEMFTKTLAPGYHKALDQKADEVDKKKDKKEREREEKERKKREKKEKEQREKEEKEKREREKKEKKEKDKRDKEERQKREKEEKKNKSLKEKADREQMEKEAAKTEELKRVTPDSEKKEVTSDEITLVGGTDTSDNVVISKWQADELLDNGKENGTVPLPTFRNVKETGNDRNTTENLSASPTIPEYMRDSVFSELLTQEIEEPLTSSKFEILPGPEDGATFVKSNLKEERNFSAPLPETLTGEYDKNIHNTVTRETLNLSRASDQDSFAVGIASGGPSLPADRDAVTSISPNLEDLVPRKSDTGPHTSEFVGAYTMSGIENDNLQIGTKIDFGISGSFSNQTNVQLKCDKPSGSVHDTHDQLKDNAEKMTGIINLPHVPSESAQCTFGEELKPVCTFNETSRVKIDIDGHQKSLSGKATSIEGDSSVSTLRTAVTHGSQPLDVVKSEPIDLVQKRDSLDNNFLPFSSSDYANQRAGADMQGPILGDQSEVNINLHVAESKDDKNHLTAAALDNTSEERSKRESAGATINFSENPSDYILDLPLLDEEFLRNTPMVSVVTEQAGAIAEPEPLTSKETAQDVCYVTTPTMQRRAHSQRRSREDRPPPVDVSYLGDDDSDGEEYIVTEPTDEGHMPEDRFRINSSPEILNVTYSNKEGQRRSHDQNRVKFQLGSLDSQDSISSDPNTPITPVTKLHKFTVEKVEEEKAASETCDFAATAPTENASKRKETLDDSSKRLRRVDRHFERMASQSLAEGTTPVREFDYQRVLSKLSHDDVAASEDEYENLLHEAATPSDEWDSSGGTDNSPEGMGATEGTNPSAAPTSALPRRPPPSHDISVDDEPEFDVREHDWRFNLQHSAEAPEEEEVSSAEEKQ
ncbi:uncharacterized protein LOC113210314 isoform X15 [Frankliniella occidentalis]|uniref:Uncharacterized protein LOC113210314 isoform X15 n=1 Tax=Frankliniella occidentalis TaxID=133901 RepID=A0A9C6U6B4_FRAOC|nr:uncharacterized protein LOC113210314 isoform X15 [Frankliniella occidentalis]